LVHLHVEGSIGVLSRSPIASALACTHVRAFAFFIFAGVSAVILIAVLLLLGVAPQTVFQTRFFHQIVAWELRDACSNRVGVLSTVLLLWGVIVASRFAVARAAKRGAA
jgi:hypothetical protein